MCKVCSCVLLYVLCRIPTASQYVTASGVTLLIRQNTEQGDTYDEIALKEYSMDALKAVISGTTIMLVFIGWYMLIYLCLKIH